MIAKDDLESYYKKIGQLIKNKREVAKKSQEQVSKYLGFESRISIANIERGKQKIHVHTLVKIANYLKIKPEELLPPLKTDSANPAFEKSLRKEGINKMSSQSLKEMLANLPQKSK